MWWIRAAVIVFGAVSYLFAVLGGESLVDLLLGAYGSIVQLLPLILSAVYVRRVTGPAVMAGLVSGVTTNYLISFGVIPSRFALGIHAGIWGLGVNIGLIVLISMIGRPQDPKHLARFELD